MAKLLKGSSPWLQMETGDVKDLFSKGLEGLLVITLMIGLRVNWLSLHRHIDDCGLQGSIGVDDVHKLGRFRADKKE